jgi:hypothetical protein
LELQPLSHGDLKVVLERWHAAYMEPQLQGKAEKLLGPVSGLSKQAVFKLSISLHVHKFAEAKTPV